MTVTLENAKRVPIREFKGLITAAEETKLSPGYSPDLSNVWVDESPGSVQTAKGFVLAGTAPTANAITFLYNFRKDDGTQLTIVSDNATVWVTRDFATFTEIITGLNSSFQLRATTVRGKIWFTNGTDSVRTYNGTTVVVLDGSGSTPNVPKGKYIVYYHERVFIGNISGSRSSARFTSLADSSGTEIAPDNSAAWPAINEIKVGDGDGDFLTGFRNYRSKLHICKAASIWRLEGFDEFSYFPQKTNANMGPRSQESIAELDGALVFVGLRGVFQFDGDTTTRVSDNLNAQVGTAAFSMANIQQSEVNQKFWLQDVSADWIAGTKPTNLDSSSNTLILKPFDSTDAEFNQGTKTDVEANSGVVLDRVTGTSPNETTDCARDKTVNVSADAVYPLFGAGSNNPSTVTDGDTNTGIRAYGSNIAIEVDFASTQRINKVVVDFVGALYGGSQGVVQNIYLQVFNGSSWVTVHTFTGAGLGAVFAGNTTVTFATISATKIRLQSSSASPNYSVGTRGLQAYRAGYRPSGKFVSRTLDYLTTPATFGKFSADYELNSGSLTFFTQSSADGSTWDGEVTVAHLGSIGSTPRRYLRWGAYFTPNGDQSASPALTKVYVGGTFISVGYQADAVILQWKSLEATHQLNEGAIQYYYRTATSLVGLTGSWVAISPGSDIISATTDTFVQWKAELSSGNPDREPLIENVTVNWIAGVAGSVQSSQLIHGTAWDGRYWFTGAESGFAYNNVVVVRGRREYETPWHLKRNWSVSPFLIFNDSLYGGSSKDGKIYRLDYGYALNTTAIDSYYQTGDLVGDDAEFQKTLFEIDMDLERMGTSAAYSLTVGVSTDRGTTWTDRTLSLQGTGRRKMPLYLIKRAHHFRVRVRTNGVDQPWILHGIELLYRSTLIR